MGRPTKVPTGQIRLPVDLVDRLGWIARIEGDSIAEIVAPLIRGEIERRYAAIEDRVRVIKAAEAGDVEAYFAADLGDPGV